MKIQIIKANVFFVKNLAKKYNEFSNIVICLYANNRVGKDLAKGNDETVSVEEKKRFG